MLHTKRSNRLLPESKSRRLDAECLIGKVSQTSSFECILVVQMFYSFCHIFRYSSVIHLPYSSHENEYMKGVQLNARGGKVEERKSKQVKARMISSSAHI